MGGRGSNSANAAARSCRRVAPQNQRRPTVTLIAAQENAASAVCAAWTTGMATNPSAQASARPEPDCGAPCQVDQDRNGSGMNKANTKQNRLPDAPAEPGESPALLPDSLAPGQSAAVFVQFAKRELPIATMALGVTQRLTTARRRALPGHRRQAASHSPCDKSQSQEPSCSAEQFRLHAAKTGARVEIEQIDRPARS